VILTDSLQLSLIIESRRCQFYSRRPIQRLIFIKFTDTEFNLPSDSDKSRSTNQGTFTTMYENRRFPSAAEPLSMDNVVSAAVRLYRSHLKTYLQIAFTAHLWALVPIYGWAKYAAISGLISRLAFGELTNQPESVEDARTHLNRHLWSSWGIYFRVGIYVGLVYLGLAIPGFITVGVLGAVLNMILDRGGGIITTTLVTILMVIILVMRLTCFYARWVIAEVPLAVEENINGSESVKRSWELTKASAFRIQGVVIVAGLVTLPIVFLFNYRT
jgi:hypothetical protein